MSVPDDVLRIEGLGVDIAGRTLLRDITLRSGAAGFHIVMGPVGVGKSTLLSVLGAQSGDAVQVVGGEVWYRGAPISAANRPAIIRQATRAERKAWSRPAATVMGLIEAALRDDPAALCLDEPTASLAHDEVLPILRRLKEESRHRVILMVTHNTQHARMVGDRMTVIGGGRVIECGEVAALFAAPRHAATKQFLKTGSMTLARPDAHARTLAPELRGMPQLGRDLAADDGDDGMVWVIRRSLALLRPEAGAGVADVIARVRDGGFDAVLVPEPAGGVLRDAMLAAGVEMIPGPEAPPDPADAARASLVYARAMEARLARGQAVLVAAHGAERVALRVATVQLLLRGLTAHDAIDLINGKFAAGGLSMADEQFLWDVELQLDLAEAQAEGGSANQPGA